MGRGSKTWGEWVKDDIKLLELQHERQYSGICGGTSYRGQTLNRSIA